MPNNLGALWLLRHDWGIGGEPNTADRESFAKALMICASGNGRLTPEERAWIVGLAAAVGTPENAISSLHSYACSDRLEDVLASMGPHVPRLLIYDALRACASDGELTHQEITGIKASAQKLGIGEQDVDKLHRIVQEENTLKRRKIEAVFPQGQPYTKRAAG